MLLEDVSYFSGSLNWIIKLIFIYFTLKVQISLLSRIRKLLAKGQNFSSVFCVGSFFPPDGAACPEWDEYKTGSKQVPVTTYILGPTNYNESKFYAGMDNGGELCENVVCLGRCGVFKTADGLRNSFMNKSNDNFLIKVVIFI